MRIEHRTEMERNDRGTWITRWRFVSYLDKTIVNEVDKAFHWKPLTREGSDRLLERSGLAIDGEFAGYDRAAYVPRESRVRLVVARASHRSSRDER